MNSCKLLISNQGFIYTLAESLKCPRVLESNSVAPNNFPMSSNGRIALFQKQFENFEHRGCAFKALVHALAAGQAVTAPARKG